MKRLLFILLVSTLVATGMYGLYIRTVNAQTTNNSYDFNEPQINSRSWVIYHILIEVLQQGLGYDDFLKLNKVAQCESNYNVNAVGDSGNALGIFQYWPKTFDSFKYEASLPELQRDIPLDQIKLTVWAYKAKKMLHWSCFSRLYPNDNEQHF